MNSSDSNVLKQLLDERRAWMKAALTVLYSELDSDQLPIAMSVFTVNPGNEQICYTISAHTGPRVERVIITDTQAFMKSITGIADITPPDDAEMQS